ncbi:MAG TPA: LptF/LptG family permease [Rectinemataceae bacterium]|nr:LptF/LptG family permease [Rectinemataceae bacterium]
MSGPRLLRRLLFRQTMLRFAGGEAFLVGIMLLADLFSSMWRFLAAEATLGGILLWLVAGIPAHITEVLPIAYLFGITLSLAEMHADGELLVVWGSGVSVQSLSLPILAFSVLMAGTMFFVNDAVTIPATAERERLFGAMTGQKGQGSQISDITIMADGGNFVYRVGYYDPTAKRLMDLDIIERNADGELIARIQSFRADWTGENWMLKNARIYSRRESGEWTEKSEAEYSRPELNEGPDSFGILREKPSRMKTAELAVYIAVLRNSGLPVVEAETDYHKRFSLLFTPFIVYGLSIAFAGLFRKNSLLMSLLFSLSTATIYYVAQMLGALSAKTGWVSPGLGIWSVTVVFIVISTTGYLRAKT